MVEQFRPALKIASYPKEMYTKVKQVFLCKTETLENILRVPRKVGWGGGGVHLGPTELSFSFDAERQ